MGISECFTRTYAQQRVGSEFQVNTYTNAQSLSKVEGFNNGNFIVTWDSEDQDGNLTGVFDQIFHDNISYSLSLSSTSSSTHNVRNSTIRPPSSSFSDISKIISPSPYPNKRPNWLWVLLGIVGETSCIGLTGYVLLRRKKKDGDGSSLELGETKPPSKSKMIEEDHSKSSVGYANVPRDFDGKIGYANIPKNTALRKDYANRPKDADLMTGYAHLPQD